MTIFGATLQIIYSSSQNECIKICTCTYFLIDALQCWLTYDNKDVLLIKGGTFEMFGHGFVVRDAPELWCCWWIKSKTLFIQFFGFFVSLKRRINMTLQRPTDLSETSRRPVTSSVSPPVLGPSCYSCFCHSEWVTTKWWTRTHWNRIYLLKRNCLFLYVLMRTSTPPTTKHMTNVLHEVTDSAYLARGCTFLGLELRYVLKGVC